MLVNWIRFFLFLAILAVLGLAVLLNWDRSDKDIVQALEQGAEQARRDALALGRGTSETLAQTGEAINERSRAIRAETKQSRQQINETGRQRQQELAEQKDAVREQLEQLETDALSWKDKLIAEVQQAAARLRAWWTGEAAADP
jgi:uncharacterized phage infection (PIP) family protein YhgE